MAPNHAELIEFAIRVNAYAVDEYEPRGFRDKGEHLLSSSLAAPWVTFFGVEQYPSSFEKAGVLLHAMVSNHPFQQANKRTATLLVLAYLRREEISLLCTADDWVADIASIADRGLSRETVIEWVKRNTTESYKLLPISDQSYLGSMRPHRI